MEVSLFVLHVSSPECDQNRRPNNATESDRRLECCVVVEQDLFRPRSFDTVRITLRGRLKTQINGHVSTSELTALKSTLHWSDFYPLSPRKSALKARSQADISFRLDDATTKSAIPSLTLELASDITCDHALGNRQHTKGRADVDYWFEALFLSRSGTKLHALAGVVHMPQPSALRLRPSNPDQTLSFSSSPPTSTSSRLLPSFAKKPSRRSGFTTTSISSSSESPTNLTIHLNPTALGTITKAPTPSPPHSRSNPSKDRTKLLIPLRLSCTTTTTTTSTTSSTISHSHVHQQQPSPLSSLLHHGATADITTKWFVNRHISSSSSATTTTTTTNKRSNKVDRSGVISHRSTITVPPFYEQPVPYCASIHSLGDDNDEDEDVRSARGDSEQRECCADAIVEVPLPVSAVAPSVEMKGLRIAYELEMKMGFAEVEGPGRGDRDAGRKRRKEKDKGKGAGSLGNVVVKIPVVLEGI